MNWTSFLDTMPLVAILRGVKPEEAAAIGDALYEGGIVCAEVPLNSPMPLKSIAALAERFAGRMLVGAGTVLTAQQVGEVQAAGASFVVSPNADTGVIAATKARGLQSLPGFFTATEAFAALAAGADGLKLFPADIAGPAAIKALKAVLPPEAPVFAVGGVDHATMAPYLAAGARGFGLGSSLYRPGAKPDEVRAGAARMTKAFRDASPAR